MVKGLLAKAPPLAAAGVLLLGGLASYQLGRLDAERQLAELRAHTRTEADAVAAQLSAVLKSTFGSAEGLVNLISVQGDIDPELFERMAGLTLARQPLIRNVAVAPGDKIRMVIPLAGNEQALGLEYRNIPTQFSMVRRARELRQAILDGPVDLVQGGRGLVYRAPIFAAGGGQTGGAERYWGVVSIVGHADAMLDAAGVNDNQQMRLALLGRSERNVGLPSEVIAGQAEVLAADPVSVLIDIPGGRWQLLATPKGGWPAINAWNSVYFRTGIANTLVLMLLAFSIARRNADVRARNQALTREIDERLEAERALRASEERFRQMAAGIDQVFYLATAGFRRFLYVSPAFERIWGRPVAPLYERAGNWLDGVHPDDRETVREAIRAGTGSGTYGAEYRVLRPDGGVRVVHARAFEFQSSAGEPLRIAGVVEDITERKRTDDELRLAAAVFSNTADGVVVTDADAKIVSINRAFTDITGYAADEAIGKTPRLLKSERQHDDFYAAMWATIERTGVWQGEIWNRRKNGEIYPEWLTITVIRDEAGSVRNYVGVFSDISAIKRSQADLERMAHFDPLTDLPNRVLFNDRLAHEVERAERHGHKVAVLLLDLDGFKTVNDSLGHPAGDDLLQQVAQRLRTCVRGEDTVSRLGGDEFAMIVADLAQAGDIAEVVRKILSVIATPFEINGLGARVTTSVGIAMFPGDGVDAAELIRNADAAMYDAKAGGRNAYRFYRAAMTELARDRLHFEHALRRAIEQQEFEVWFQPKFALDGDVCFGAEALLRWRDPQRGLISPLEFIPLAERTGLIVPIGEIVLEQVCAHARRWLDAGLPVGRLAINVAGPQIERSDFVAALRRALEAHRLPPATLEIEITETMIMESETRVREALEEIRKLGITVAVDDFGTGYSSLSYLKVLPIDTLKIDRAFVRDLPDDASDVAIVRAIIALGRSLDFRIVAEGVESEAQRDLLRREGCDAAQGFLYSRPLAADAFARFLAGAADRVAE